MREKSPWTPFDPSVARLHYETYFFESVFVHAKPGLFSSLWMTAAFLLRFRLHSDAPPEIRALYKQAYDDILSDDSERFYQYLYKWIAKLEEDDIGTEIDREYLNRCRPLLI